MYLDLTIPIEKETFKKLLENANDDILVQKFGHLGTHFDIMNKEFPLEYCNRRGKLMDISQVAKDEITVEDVRMERIEEGDFVILYSGVLEKYGYASKEYFDKAPQLSHKLIQSLIEKKISILGIDMAGVRKGKEHSVADQLFADHNAFIVENLSGLSKLLPYKNQSFVVHTYPLALKGASGLTSRVIAEVPEI
ncbi:cyclase family protein [Lutispora thermophila]|uniref:Kynurenine formamidase n=1 Tax=Lutispora thermophila DSM 19022 TaxID=1122184 RepID=A0A1M6AX60_9FIRM|nr:cyclase family protein [Lutispora thermophila]SHI41040.1 Kynurenine formamidase [Lutispora thermophila DSM 19022]